MNLTSMISCWRDAWHIQRQRQLVWDEGFVAGPVRGFPIHMQAVGISVGVSVAERFSITFFTLLMERTAGSLTRNDMTAARLLAQLPDITVSRNVHV